MIPPLLRRCPDCGHVGLASRFAAVERWSGRVECHACGYCFETVDGTLLN
jgi:transcription elongation factor Elf1